jgi:hypothetical protein
MVILFRILGVENIVVEFLLENQEGKFGTVDFGMIYDVKTVIERDHFAEVVIRFFADTRQILANAGLISNHDNAVGLAFLHEFVQTARLHAIKIG